MSAPRLPVAYDDVLAAVETIAGRIHRTPGEVSCFDEPSVGCLGVGLEREQEVFSSGPPGSPSYLPLHLRGIALEERQLIDSPMQEITPEFALLSLL